MNEPFCLGYGKAVLRGMVGKFSVDEALSRKDKEMDIVDPKRLLKIATDNLAKSLEYEKRVATFKAGQRVRVKSGKRKGIEGTMIRSRFISNLGFISYYVEFDTEADGGCRSGNFSGGELEAIVA